MPPPSPSYHSLPWPILFPPWDPLSSTHTPPVANSAACAGVGATSLSAPSCPLIIPAFWGGALTLKSGLEVRILDAGFDKRRSTAAAEPGSFDKSRMVVAEGSGATDGFGFGGGGSLNGGADGSDSSDGGSGGDGGDGDGDLPEVECLARVQLTLVDASGRRVGEPVWCNVREVLKELAPSCCIVAEFASEDELRNRSRLKLHEAEQRKLAIAALAADRRRALYVQQSRSHAPLEIGSY